MHVSRIFGEVTEVFRYHELLRNLVVRDVKVRYKRSVLGFLWMMLNPLLIMIVLSLIFSELFRVTTKNYTVYLLSGIIFWNFFSQSTAVTVKSFTDNSNLIKKVAMPKSILPFSAVLSASVNFLFSLVPLYLVTVFSGTTLSSSFYLVPLSAILVFFFALGISLIVSTATVFFHDTVHIYDVLLFAWMYSTPVFYPEAVVPEKYRFILEWNPLYHYLNLFRSGLYLDMTTVSSDIYYSVAFSSVTLLGGWLCYTANKDKVIYYL